jgi:IS5 family transposase
LQQDCQTGKYQPRTDLQAHHEKVVAQQKQDKNKIYSLHEPSTSCIAKGKVHKQFEFGSKVSFAVVPGVNIIVGVKNFNGNPNDTTTLQPVLTMLKK